jgi:predicted RNA binding protein YcfA (HicA-like mRNA interferase family)
MPKQTVTPQEVRKVLIKLGFVETDLGSHALFRHKSKKASVTLPTRLRNVPTVHLRAIEQTLENYNIMSRDEFEEQLEVPESDSLGRARVQAHPIRRQTRRGGRHT